MPNVQLIRIVVASPSDVQAERNLLPGVLDELNRGIAADRGLRLELKCWEMDAYPGFHPDGPQGLIDPILNIEECDILIGIFWKRFGTPTKDAKSGTEHEFLRAYNAWQQQQRPQIMVYFNQKPYAPKTKEDIEQWGKVLEFRESFPSQGLQWTYEGEPEFEKLVRTHLTNFIRQQKKAPSAGNRSDVASPPSMIIQNTGSGGIAVGPGAIGVGEKGIAIGGNIYGNVTVGAASVSSDSASSATLREAYLNWLIGQVRSLPLSGVDPDAIREETRRDLDLAAVYTALMTQRSESSKDRDLKLDREVQHLSAVAVLNLERRLALLGDPGSGKSTFVNFVALSMAGELLGRSDANLAALLTPVPEDEQDSPRQKKSQPQPWDHGPLLPVRIVLREFVARGLTADNSEPQDQRDGLWRFIIRELPDSLRDYAEPLRRELLEKGGLLLLDGLDEVPEADHRRVQVKAAVEQFADAFPKVRILVTSRTYAYQKQDWKLRDFAETALTPFGAAQIHRFVERWYAFVGQARRLSDADAQGRATVLNQAIERNPRLHELATRPLLLTLMASLHAWRGGTLPDQREELYANAVDLLLDQWERAKYQRRADGSYAVEQPSLNEWLQVDQKVMRQFLNRLAFAAHSEQPNLVGTADIAQDTLVGGLMKLNLNPDVRPQRLVEYLRDRAGLLEPRGVGIYAFPHRTFQEYLAACHLTERDDFPDNIADLLRSEPNRWREVTLLAGAKAVRGATSHAWLLAEALCFRNPPVQLEQNEEGYWGALLAAQVLIENKSLGQISKHNQVKVERLRQWLLCTLTQSALPPIDRAQAGDALAVLGDPRFRTDAWFLPDEPLLGFIEIPAGPFLMGSDRGTDPQAHDNEVPQHTLDLPGYYISRYPVTVAQYRVFVEHSGHEPEESDSLLGPANYPVVLITWHEARKYCEWLTERLREWDGTPEPLATLLRKEGWQVTLPSEAEWEKAARGSERRIYPWGDEFDAAKANTEETGIGRPSAVGGFPQGVSPYRCIDMAGNVWEWTRSLWGKEPFKLEFKYPYNPNDGREQLEADDEILRVLRGGCCWYGQRYARCADRFRDDPDFRYDGYGCRIVVRPCLPSDL